ncbi:cytochrome c oxidase subunit 4 [Naumannella halotolerans]|uniref:cytochrome c oxidase subunit 4 n=1 Tax=Naumannella halotolerans TaxID=993414 RepID=UPI00370D01BF
MKSSAWSFGGVAIFIFVATIVYWFLSHEIVGTVALIMALLMCVMIWGYLLITLKSIGTPLEDDVDATIEDGAGVIGFFPPSSIWPFWCSLAAGVFVLGPVYGWWLSILGAAVGLWALFGWVYQYYVGDYKH